MGVGVNLPALAAAGLERLQGMTNVCLEDEVVAEGVEEIAEGVEEGVMEGIVEGAEEGVEKGSFAVDLVVGGFMGWRGTEDGRGVEEEARGSLKEGAGGLEESAEDSAGRAGGLERGERLKSAGGLMTAQDSKVLAGGLAGGGGLEVGGCFDVVLRSFGIV